MSLKAYRITYLTKYKTLIAKIVLSDTLPGAIETAETALKTGADPLESVKTLELLDEDPIIDQNW